MREFHNQDLSLSGSGNNSSNPGLAASMDTLIGDLKNELNDLITQTQNKGLWVCIRLR